MDLGGGLDNCSLRPGFVRTKGSSQLLLPGGGEGRTLLPGRRRLVNVALPTSFFVQVCPGRQRKAGRSARIDTAAAVRAGAMG